MSNKTNQSVLVNDTSSYYLKQYAALQFPGSVDNFGTKTPIHLLQQQEESEHSVSLREACDSDYDLDGAQFLFEGATYDSVTDLVKDNLLWLYAQACLVLRKGAGQSRPSNRTHSQGLQLLAL